MNNNETFKYHEILENISIQLNHLESGAETIADTIEQMLVSPDVLSCFRLISYSITGVKQYVDEQIDKLKKTQKSGLPEERYD